MRNIKTFRQMSVTFNMLCVELFHSWQSKFACVYFRFTRNHNHWKLFYCYEM